MINLNEIAFIDTDGFDYNDGECLVRFDTVMYCPDKKLITFAVTKQGRIRRSIQRFIICGKAQQALYEPIFRQLRAVLTKIYPQNIE